jgi:alkyl hydroperoxide reductase subunit AhpC
VDLRDHYEDFQGRNTEIIALAVHNLAGAGQVANLLGDGIATPSVFIIDTSGQIVWSHVGRNAVDRPGIQTILENLPEE